MEYLALSNVAAQCKLFAPFITACAVAICQDRRYRFSVYRKVFYGEELVSWLMDGKLVRTRYVGAFAVCRAWARLCRDTMCGMRWAGELATTGRTASSSAASSWPVV